MKVPYSMDESEPDLYGTLGGHQPDDQDLQSSYHGRDGGYGDCTKRSAPQQEQLDLKPVPMYVFYNLEELVSSEVFQHQLSMALKSKQRQIDELRVEILALDEKLKGSKKAGPCQCVLCEMRSKEN